MAVVKREVWPTKSANSLLRIVEHELDMDRAHRSDRLKAGFFRQLLEKLVPASQWSVRSPMRSIAREIEEIWPAADN